jgi:predicted RNase H-like HicB family nuclease
MKKMTHTSKSKSLTIVFDREVDGRWIGEITALPGVLAYGKTKSEARRKVYSVALRTLADRAEQGHVHTSVSRIFEYGMARG